MSTRLYFATDIHGSEKCFRKFLNAWKFYDVRILVLGGDITGKAIVPIVRQHDGMFKVNYLGQNYALSDGSELGEFESWIRNSGYYVFRTTEEEVQELNTHKERLDELFWSLMKERLEGWIKLADERLKGTGIECFVTGGNDDRFEVEELLGTSEVWVAAEGEVCRIDDKHEMISSGYSNMTPWKCPRDILEEELKDKILKMTSQVEDIQNCIFNLHVPPHDSGLDYAPELDENLTPKLQPGGEASMVPVGSIAVSEVIRETQPLLGLHGHIHESRGIRKVGKTVCINPGSQYGEGILNGVIVKIAPKKVEDYFFVSG